MKLDQNKIKSILEGVEISDGAVKGLVALVESYVTAEKGETTKRLKAHYTAQLNKLTEAAQKYGDYVKAEMGEKINEYIRYASKEYIKENQGKFNQLEQFERMKAVFESVKQAFEYNGFKLDESAQVKDLQGQLTEAKNSFNEIFENFTKANDELEVAKQAILFESMTKGLTSSQKLKAKQLAEGISFDSIKEFKQGVGLIVENVKRSDKPATPSKKSTLTEQATTVPATKPVDTQMAAILAAMKR